MPGLADAAEFCESRRAGNIELKPQSRESQSRFESPRRQRATRTHIAFWLKFAFVVKTYIHQKVASAAGAPETSALALGRGIKICVR